MKANRLRVAVAMALSAASSGIKALLPSSVESVPASAKHTDRDGMPAKHNGGQKTGIAAAKRAAKKRRAMKARSPK